VESACGADPLRPAHEDLIPSTSPTGVESSRRSWCWGVDVSRVLSMWVPVMEIRIVRVSMAQPRMFMRMRVRLAGRLAPGMVVLMMLVVDVQVVVR
jgi:hypothetical protein